MVDQQKIAVIAEDYPPNQGGVAEYAANVSEALARKGHDVQVVSARVSGDEAFDVQHSVPVARIGKRDVRRQSLSLVARWRAVQQYQHELENWLIQAYGGVAPDWALVASVSDWAMACVKGNIPYAVAVHGGDAFGKRSDWIRSHYRRFAVRRVFDRAEKIFTNSDYTREQVVKSGPWAAKTITTYCGVAIRFLAAAAPYSGLQPGNGPRLLTVSRLVPIKACDIIIDAVAMLAGRYPGLVLDIAGDGPEREALERRAQSLGVGDRVRFLGYVTDVDEKARLFSSASIYVQAGRIDPRDRRAEAFGITFAEAAAMGRPSIGPDFGGVREVINDGQTGILTPPGDVEALAGAIDRLAADPALCHRLGQAAKARADVLFNYDQIVESISCYMGAYKRDLQD